MYAFVIYYERCLGRRRSRWIFGLLSAYCTHAGYKALRAFIDSEEASATDDRLAAQVHLLALAMLDVVAVFTFVVDHLFGPRKPSLPSSSDLPRRTTTTRSGRAAPSPLDSAGVASRVMYWWISPLIRLGQRRRLEVDDVPDLPARDATSTAADTFERAYDLERTKPRPSFLRLLTRLYGWEVSATCFIV